MTTSPVAQQLKLVVVPHTHWDREWYQPFEVFRRRLVQLIDSLVRIFETDPRYTHFMLDGQSIVLEDYLEIRPEMEGKLRELITTGKVAVGPWYVLPDEFLVSGESLIRNLQIGMATARRFGRSMELGYLPDSFGHVPQMPQIFAGFGFDAGCLWRGVDDQVPGLEWNWEALDGTQIYLQWLAGGYGNFGNLPPQAGAAAERLEQVIAHLDKHAKSKTRMLLNGSDHLMPQPFLPDHLEYFRARHPNWEISQGTLPEVIAQARAESGALETVRGELRSASETSLLPGVLSARTYLKIENARAQTLLERWVEPFAALAGLQGRDYPAGLVRHAWRMLLQNHPHDSICGCSVDAVHQQMMTRFMRVDQLGTLLRHESFAALQGEDPDNTDAPRQEGLRLYNPHPWSHTSALETELVLDCPAGEEPQFALLDEHDQPVPFEVLDDARGVRVVNQSPLYPYNVPTATLKLRLATSFPAMGYRTLRVERHVGGTAVHPELYAGNNWIENRFFKVRATGGRVEIFDKSLEETVVHAFEDQGDRGDEYNFCPVDGELPAFSGDWHWDVREIMNAGASLHLKLAATWQLPEGLFEDRLSRIGASPLEIELLVSLHAGVRRVEFQTRLDNQSRDHRFRAAFKAAGAIPRTHADTAFGWVTRDSHVPERPWAEKPMGTFPMVSQVLIDRPLGQAGIAAVGLHEYEAVGDTLFLTMFRSVGWLSREDLSTRKGDAGPMLAAPEAQCLGEQTFRYAWTSQNDDEAYGAVQRRAQEFVVPPVAAALAAWQGYQSGEFLAIDQPAWQLSALKRAEGSEAIVLRVFNLSPDRREGTITLGFPVRSASKGRLDETIEETLVVDQGRITTSLRGFEIATFVLACQ